MPRCSSFTSHRTFSRLTVQVRTHSHSTLVHSTFTHTFCAVFIFLLLFVFLCFFFVFYKDYVTTNWVEVPAESVLFKLRL